MQKHSPADFRKHHLKVQQEKAAVGMDRMKAGITLLWRSETLEQLGLLLDITQVVRSKILAGNSYSETLSYAH